MVVGVIDFDVVLISLVLVAELDYHGWLLVDQADSKVTAVVFVEFYSDLALVQVHVVICVAFHDDVQLLQHLIEFSLVLSTTLLDVCPWSHPLLYGELPEELTCPGVVLLHLLHLL